MNGTFAGAGCARFVGTHPEYDSVDIGRWLNPGPKSVVVELHFFGAASYQTMPDGREGFIARGAVGGAVLSTHGAWEARGADAWDNRAARISFVQGPPEICDTRHSPGAWYAGEVEEGWCAPDPVKGAPWGTLAPRSAPLPDGRPLEPVSLSVVGPLKQSEDIIGFRLTRDPGTGPGAAGSRVGRAFARWLRSAGAVSVELGLWRGRSYLNGEDVTPLVWEGRGMRQAVRVELDADDNEPSRWAALLESTDGRDAVVRVGKGSKVVTVSNIRGASVC